MLISMQLLLILATSITAFETGFAPGIVRPASPPRGWRSWNFFECNINQDILQQQVDAITAPRTGLDGKPTSLRDLGFNHVGLDDCWQKCDHSGHDFHNKTTGMANIDASAGHFPDMKSMVDYGTAKNVTMGFYFDNCRCHETGEPTHYPQDAQLTETLGYGGVKIDSCGNSRDMDTWAKNFANQGKDLLVENCGNGPEGTNPKKDPTPMAAFIEQLETTCPYSFFRVSVDVAPQFYSTVYNMNRVVPYLGVTPLSRQGCWAYPDMLEVGVKLSHTESRTHFAMWAVISSPLILGFDLTDDVVLNSVWNIIANEEVLNVSATWIDHPGRLVRNSSKYFEVYALHGAPANRGDNVSLPEYQIWAKPMGRGAQAVLIVNIAEYPQPSINISLADLGLPTSVAVRDLWSRSDMGVIHDSLVATNVGVHDGMFVMLTPTTTTSA